MSDKKLAFSGVQPIKFTRVLRSAYKFYLSKEMECIFCVVDLHAIRTFKNRRAKAKYF